MKKWMPWILVVVMALWVVATFRRPSERSFHTTEFGKLPVLLNGRVQPLDSVARNSLLILRGKQSIKLAEGGSLTAIEWLEETLMKPRLADTREIFRIDHPEVLGLLNLPLTSKFFAFDKLQSGSAEVVKQAELIDRQKIDPQVQTSFQKAVHRLAQNLMLYQRLKNSLKLEVTTNMLAQVQRYQTILAPGLEAARNREEGKQFDQAVFEELLQHADNYRRIEQAAYLLMIPSPDPHHEKEDWSNVGRSLMASIQEGKVHPAVMNFARMSSAFEAGEADAFNRAVAEHQEWLRERYKPELTKGRSESFFNHVALFYKSLVIYLLAFILACVSWFNRAEWPRRAAAYLVLLGLLIHTTGLVYRMVLEGRPPVTNLYSSAIFIGWGAVILGVVLERFYKDGIGSVIAGLSGFTTLIIAHNLSLGGDTMEMLRAVLDTNFWLATHVVAVTIGYSATFVAGLLAIMYIFRGAATTTLDSKLAKSLSKMVYGVICFATLFSFVGTVLGGIWADQSWGRFWGWDPKENGALLIVIWNAFYLHARWGKVLSEKALMAAAVFGNVVTSFSWFGVNMLSIGLHSYGFMDTAFWWLVGFDATQLALIAVALMPLRFWRSHAALREAAAPPPGKRPPSAPSHTPPSATGLPKPGPVSA